MKFEIYSDSEFIYDIDEKHDLTDDNEYPIAQLKQLEQITQAVKKTQKKLDDKKENKMMKCRKCNFKCYTWELMSKHRFNQHP